MFIFGWVSLTRLKFNTSFCWSYKIVIGFLIWLVMSQVTDSMCKYAHNSYVNNWSGDNASNKITCSLWDTLCILESLFFRTLGFPSKSLSPGFGPFFWLSVGRKLSLFSFWRKVKSRCFGLVCFFFKQNNFSIFEKMLWGSGAIFLRLLGSHRER